MIASYLQCAHQEEDLEPFVWSSNYHPQPSLGSADSDCAGDTKNFLLFSKSEELSADSSLHSGIVSPCLIR